MIRRIAIAVLAVVSFGVVGLFVLAWRPKIAPVAAPTLATFSAESITRGETLAAAGHCVSCHTRPGGQPYAGGYPVQTPFGIIYGTNITPDPKTGIGLWSLQAFTRAMREGVSRDGSHLFPAFPYYAYTGLCDDDVSALYAYVMTRPPVSATIPANTLPFPLNVRAFQEGWKLLFFRSGRYRTNPSKSAEWNRGAYLSEALSDCAGCHTPRNAFGAEEKKRPYAGAVVEGWIAPALTKANPSPVPWTEEEMFRYLRNGVTALHGATAATMTDVIRDGLGLEVVPATDVRAVAVYFNDLGEADARKGTVQTVVREALATSSVGIGQPYDPDANLYVAACVSCHYNAAPAPLPARPELALSSALTLSEPTNLIQVVLNGVKSREGAPGLVMPAYASSFTNDEIVRLAAYLRRTRTKFPPWTDLKGKVSSIRKRLGESD